MKSFILITIFLLFSTNTFSFNKKIILRGGANTTYGRAKLFNRSETSFWGGGMHSNAGYRYNNYEFNITANAYWGNVKSVNSKVGETVINGKADIRTFVISIYPKYLFKTLYKNIWRPYIGAGIIWSQHTLKMKEYTVSNGQFNDDNRMAYLSRGITLIIGIEESLEFKEMHPVYLEIQYSFMSASKISKLDASNHKEIESIHAEKINDRVRSHTVMFNMGMTIF